MSQESEGSFRKQKRVNSNSQTVNEQSVEYHATDEVPLEQRDMGFWDMIFLWIGANSNNASWYLGGSIAGVTFGSAFIVGLVANPLAYIIMAIVGYMGYKFGVSTMALTRPAFGIKGSLLPTILNTIVFVGWAVVNTFIAVISMSFIFKDIFGWKAYGETGSALPMIFSIVIMTLLNLAAVSLGRQSIKVVERIGMVLLLILGVWVTVIVMKSHPLTEIINWQPNTEARLPIGSAIDLMAAFSLTWVLGIAEFTRHAKTPKAATVAPLIGATTSLIWFVFVGLLATIGVALSTGNFDPENSDPSSLVSSLGLGWIALTLVVATAVTTNVVNLTAGGISITNITKKIKPLHSIWTITIISGFLMLIPLYVTSFLDTFQGFLDYAGMALSALLGILIVDYLFIRRRKYDVEKLESKGDKYWYNKGVNISAIIVWGAGVLFYLGIHNMNIVTSTIGAVYPTIIITGLIYGIISLRKRERSV